MGMDLYPRNKDAGGFSFGGFGWAWMLEAGVGLPVGHFKGLAPGEFIYLDRPDKRSLGYNDGAKVTAKEAKQMAMVARWVVAQQRALHDQLDQRSEDEQEHIRDNRNRLYNPPVRKDWLDHIARFADWAEKSGGFRVN